MVVHGPLPPAVLGPPEAWVPGPPITWGLGAAHPKAKPKRLAEWQEAIGWEWRRLRPGRPLGGPVALAFRFRVKNPKKDLTNLLKAVEDALKQVAFGDDNRVYWVLATKEPAEEGGEGVEIWVRDWGGPSHPEHHNGL